MRVGDLDPIGRSYYDDGWLACHMGHNVAPMVGMPEPFWRGFFDRLNWLCTDPATSSRALYGTGTARLVVQQQVLAHLRGQP
jgi:hypothetical protein